MKMTLVVHTSDDVCHHVVQGMTVKLRPCLYLQACGCFKWEFSAGTGVKIVCQADMAHIFGFVLYFVRSYVDSGTKPEYYYYYD